MAIQFEYYTYQQNLAIEKINEEIKFYENNEYGTLTFVRDHVAYLETRIGTGRSRFTNSYKIDKNGNRSEIKKMNMDEYSKDMHIMTYGRPWNKLKEIHKIMKINEFVDALEYKKTDIKKINRNKKYIKEEIIEGIKTKKFIKNKNTIEYDKDQMIIISIDCIDYNKKKGIYKIEWE